jgi:hypothetical protein
MNQMFTRAVAVAALGTTFLIPVLSSAQTQAELNRRQQKKNEWRNIAYAAGAVGLLGLLNKDSTLTFAGAAGALYAVHRYEQDRKSQNKLQRARAAYFSRGSFTRNGVRYVRRTTWKNGKKYYYFARVR